MVFGEELYNDLKSKQSTTKTLSISESFSIYEYGLECMREMDNIIREIMKDSYISAGYNINESFIKDYMKDNFSWKKIITFIIDGFKKALENIFNAFKAVIIRILYSDKTIEKYKKELLNYNNPIKINFPYVHYTNLGESTPNPLLYLRFSEEYVVLEEDLRKLAKNSKKDIFISKVNGMRERLTFDIKNDEYYNTIRAEVLNGLGNYSEYANPEQYEDGLYIAFRNGCREPISGHMIKTLDAYQVRESAERFLNSKKILTDVDKQKTNLTSTSDKVCKKITSIKLESITNSFGKDHEIDYALNNMLKTKSGQLKTNCDIYLLAFNTKLQAIKDALLQDKRICFEAITDMIATGGINNG